MTKMFSYMFVSRNKDNKNVAGFKQRCHSFLAYEMNDVELERAFSRFAAEGVEGEKSRCYRSVNTRDEEKTRKAFMVKMLMDEPSLVNLEAVLVSVANKAENRAEKKWLFDFDSADETTLARFEADLDEVYDGEFSVMRTPNGFALVTEHGFDTRGFLDKWSDVCSLKKDDMLFLAMKEN